MVSLASSCGGGEESPVVASYKDTPLRLRQLEQYIPKGVSEEDSTRYADHYVDQWLKAQAIADVAMQQIPNLEERIEFKVEDYRQKLIMHEFSSRIIRDSLDTLITNADIEQYYRSYTDNFIATSSMYSFYYIVCKAENTGDAGSLINSGSAADIEKLVAWARDNALEFKLDSTYTTEAAITEINKGYFGDLKDAGSGRVVKWSGVIQGQRRRYYFKMLDKIKVGEPLPILLAKERINRILLNERKVNLIEETEKRIVQEARVNNYIKD